MNEQKNEENNVGYDTRLQDLIQRALVNRDKRRCPKGLTQTVLIHEIHKIAFEEYAGDNDEEKLKQQIELACKKDKIKTESIVYRLKDEQTEEKNYEVI